MAYTRRGSFGSCARIIGKRSPKLCASEAWETGNNQPSVRPPASTAVVGSVWNRVYHLEKGTPAMADTVVTLRLNQQQLELMDRTIARGIAADRTALVRLALREYAAAHKADANSEPPR
jgi:hypothetical protein